MFLSLRLYLRSDLILIWFTQQSELSNALACFTFYLTNNRKINNRQAQQILIVFRLQWQKIA